MATNTPNLSLILPGFGEFTDDWWEPLNENFTAVDTAVAGVQSEIIAARQSKTSLLAFLSVGHNADGSLIAAPEVVKARNSPIYGIRDGLGALVPLKSRLDSIDFEVLKGRYGQPSLIDGLALAEPGLKDKIISGATNANGYPTWMSGSGANLLVDGSTTPIYLMIGGYVARVRTAKTLPMSGAAGTYYIYATYQTNGVVTVDGDSAVAPPSIASGQTSQDTNSDMTLFTDTTTNFSTSDVKAGDTLTLLTSGDAGTFVIQTVAPSANQNQLQIIGAFPVGGLSSINYTVRDPLAVTLGFAATPTVVAGRLYIGEADLDGSGAIIAVRTRAHQTVFNGEYRSYDVTTTATVEQIWTHNLGTDLLDVEIHVSQSNSGSQPVEILTPSDLASTLAVSITDGKVLNFTNNLNFNPGTSNATLTGTVTASLTGAVTGALTGVVTPARSVAVKWDRNNIYVKNVVPNYLYKDYAGATHQTGFVRVVVRKRG